MSLSPDFDSAPNLASYMSNVGGAARLAAQILRLASAKQKSDAIKAMARCIKSAADDILQANVIDVQYGQEKRLSPAFLDRLKLDEDGLNSIAAALRDIAAQDDPVGHTDESWTRPNGLKISKVRVPIGVIGMIYESRPNVTADAGALCLKSGNACILRAGSDSLRSSAAIHAAMIQGLKDSGLPATAIQLLQTTDRDAVGHLLGGLNGVVDLIIPRGGKSLIRRVQQDARVPVLAHLEGLCHSYVHSAADPQKALEIVVNAKMRRTGVCGSTETVLIDRAMAETFLPELTAQLIQAGCELRGDARARKIAPDIYPAQDRDFATEHLSPILNVAIVGNIDAALAHIAHYGSGHTDAIITEDSTAADKFLTEVDSAICIHNASTQFADGGEFGFGAEIGIATGRLHARGPVGAQHLTTYKYQLRGTGQTRP